MATIPYTFIYVCLLVVLRSFVHLSVNAVKLMLIVSLHMAHGFQRKVEEYKLPIKPPPLVGDMISRSCWNFTHGNWKIKEFYSPNYPNKYLNQTECSMFLEAPVGYKIQLDFRDKFILEASDQCKYDFLELRDGPYGYSPLIGRFCGKLFPPIIETNTRYLWARFKTDDLLQHDGFRAVYKYIKDDAQEEADYAYKVCRIPLETRDWDGYISSDSIPSAITEGLKTFTHQALDCTWEIRVEPDKKITLTSEIFRFPSPRNCNDNFIELYQQTTADTSLSQRLCAGPSAIIRSTGNRVYIRLYAKRLKYQPSFKFFFTTYRNGTAKTCRSSEFSCGSMCLDKSLICNGKENCESGHDEADCKRLEREKNEPTPFPYNIVIMGVVGGVFFTVLILVICFTCRQRKREKRNRKEALRQQQQRSTIELAALRNNQSGNTTITRQNGALPNSHYVTFPRANGSVPRETSQRTSTASSPQPPSEVSFGDQMSDSGNYKKFLTMDQYLDDDASPRTSYYGSQGGTVVTVERHPPPPSVDSGYGDMKCPTIKEDQAEVEAKYKYPMLKSSGNMPYAIRETPSPLTYIVSPGKKNVIGMSKLSKPDGPMLFSSFKGLEIDTSMDIIEPL